MLCRRLLEATSVMITAASVDTSTNKSDDGKQDESDGQQDELDDGKPNDDVLLPNFAESETQIPIQFPAQFQYPTSLQDSKTPKHKSLFNFNHTPVLSTPNTPVPTVPHGNIISVAKKPCGRPKKNTTPTLPQQVHYTASTACHSTLPVSWCDCLTLYPPTSKIIQALQDPGKTIMKVLNGVRQHVAIFPLVQKLSSKIYQQIQMVYKPKGLTKNTTWGCELLNSLILMAPQLTDAMHLDAFFHKYAAMAKYTLSATILWILVCIFPSNNSRVLSTTC